VWDENYFDRLVAPIIAATANAAMMIISSGYAPGWPGGSLNAAMQDIIVPAAANVNSAQKAKRVPMPAVLPFGASETNCQDSHNDKQRANAKALHISNAYLLN
jgi:hypothetical protein